MENYSYNSYPESGGSSPRSREIEFENPPPWEDQQPPTNYKVKFMCSYGGKIHPRPHDNQLSYIGGETKILSVDRNIKFQTLIGKLSAICDSDGVAFKYQLPGEDLDALISVTTEDDLDHMMNEYDRVCRAAAKPARLRLFLFPAHGVTDASPRNRSFGSTDGKSEKERFVEALNSGPIHASPPPSTVLPPSNVDFLFGIEKGMTPPQQAVTAKGRDQMVDSGVHERIPGFDDRAIETDPIQKHIQDLQRLRLEEQRRRSDDNIPTGYGGEYYAQRVPEKMPPSNMPANAQGGMQVQANYWPEKQNSGGVYPQQEQQPVYMIPSQGGMYPAQMGRPVPGPNGQGYYAVQRMQPEVYREQQVYNVGSAAPPGVPSAPTNVQQAQGPPKMAAFPDGMGMVRTATGGGVGMMDAGYAMGYDNGMGRQVYYAAPPGGAAPPPPQYQMPAVAVSGDMRRGGGSQDGGVKMVGPRNPQNST